MSRWLLVLFTSLSLANIALPQITPNTITSDSVITAKTSANIPVTPITPGYILIKTKVADPISGRFLSIKRNKLYFEDKKTLYVIHLEVLESMQETNGSVTVQELKSRRKTRINFNAYTNRIIISKQTSASPVRENNTFPGSLSPAATVAQRRTHFGKLKQLRDNTKSLVNSPIPGFTKTPSPGNISCYVGYERITSTSIYSPLGKERDIGYYFDDTIAPELTSSRLFLNTQLAFTEHVGIRLFVPFVSQARFSANPAIGYESFYSDLIGETGLGDISAGFWVANNGKPNSHLMLFGDIGIPTGTDPDDISPRAFSSTGSGLWSISAGAAADLMSTKTVMLSLLGIASVHKADTVIVDNKTYHLNSPLNLNLVSRVKLTLTPQLNVGLDLIFYYVEQTLANGYYEYAPKINSFVFSPRFAYRVSKKLPDVDVTGSYLYNFSGRGIYRANGFDLGAQIYF